MVETKLVRITELARTNPAIRFTSLYHHMNKELLLECHRELDGVSILTDQATPRNASTYWAVLKKRLIEEGFQLLTICKQLKLKAADGKRYNIIIRMWPIQRNICALS